jgi:hypothetical protein
MTKFILDQTIALYTKVLPSPFLKLRSSQFHFHLKIVASDCTYLSLYMCTIIIIVSLKGQIKLFLCF